MIKLMGVFLALGAMSVHAADVKSSVVMTGSAEGGMSQSWISTPPAGLRSSENQFFTDNLTWKTQFNITDKTFVMLNNAFALEGGNAPVVAGTPVGGAGTAPGYGAGFNSSAYYSAATSHFGRLYFTNAGGYIQHKFSETLTTTFGHFRIPFGMETLHERYDMPNYYYSDTFGVMHAYGWEYDIGAKGTWTNWGPGTLELSVTDGRFTDEYYPATAVRYSFEAKAGGGSFTPVASLYTGRWRGGPGDLGMSAGTNAKFGKLSTNLEWVYASRNLTFADDARTKDWSLYLEPTYSMDNDMSFSLKAEYSSNTVGTAAAINDMNVGLGFAKGLGDGLRFRATYAHRGLKGDRSSHVNDFRLLLGTHW